MVNTVFQYGNGRLDAELKRMAALVVTSRTGS